MEFSKEQIQAIQHTNGPCLVLAVPGAGKTTILIKRMINLIEKEGISQNDILAITFTKNSANDMRQRIKSFEPSIDVKNIKTIHSLCYEILTYYAQKHHTNFKMLDSKIHSAAIFNLFNPIKIKSENSALDIDAFKQILSQIAMIKSSGKTPSEMDGNTKEFYDILRPYQEAYEAFKEQNRLYDYDDLIIESNKFLDTDSELKNHFRNKYKYICLDEAQDTSDLQWQIIKKLLTKNQNLFAVADDDQSIYRFRGASPEMLMRFDKEFIEPKIIYLEINYRSRLEIVNCASRLIKNNRIRYKKNILANKEKNSTVKVQIFKTREKQYHQVIETLREVSGSSAIIYRNNLSSVALMDVLDRNMIHFQLKDHNIDFFQQSFFKDIYRILAFIKDPTDYHLFSQIYYKLKGYLSKKEVESLSTELGTNIFEKILKSKNIPNYKKELIKELMDACEIVKKKFPEKGLSTILYSCGYYSYLENFKSITKRGLESNLKQYRTLLQIAQYSRTIDDFINRLKELYHLALRDNPSNISLMSLHSSKGLEFDNVLLIDLIDSEIPGYYNNSSELEEERRLLYVGMTRAKEKLFLFSYKKDADTKVNMCRFLEELK